MGINGQGASAREEGGIGGEMGFSVEDVAVLLVGGLAGGDHCGRGDDTPGGREAADVDGGAQ